MCPGQRPFAARANNILPLVKNMHHRASALPSGGPPRRLAEVGRAATRSHGAPFIQSLPSILQPHRIMHLAYMHIPRRHRPLLHLALYRGLSFRENLASPFQDCTTFTPFTSHPRNQELFFRQQRPSACPLLPGHTFHPFVSHPDTRRSPRRPQPKNPPPSVSSSAVQRGAESEGYAEEAQHPPAHAPILRRGWEHKRGIP